MNKRNVGRRRVYWISLAVCAVIVVLLVIFNARTDIPFSIGVHKFDIPFFVAFFIAFGMGAVSWAMVRRRLSRKSTKGSDAQAAETRTSAQTDAPTETRTSAQDDARVETKADAPTETQTDTQAETKTDKRADARAETKTDRRAEKRANARSKRK